MKLQVFPAPDADYQLQIEANVHPARLGPAQQTSLLTEQFPRAIEKAAFRQAALFMKAPADVAMYDQEMQMAVAEANGQTARRKRDETDKRPRETSNMTGT